MSSGPSPTPPSGGSQVGKALGAPFRAIGVLVANPGLWHLAAIPCAIALFVLVGLGLGAWYGHDWITSWVATPPDQGGTGWWWWPAKVLTFIGLLVAVPVLTAIVAPAVAEPFLGALARRARKAVTGQAPSPPTGLYADFVAPIWHLLLKLGFLLLVHLLLLPLLLVPGAGAVVYGVAGWAVTAFVLGLTYLDYPLDTAPRLLPPGERRAFFYKHWPAGFTLGLGATLTTLIPCLTFVLLPVLVVAAVLVYLDLGGDEALPKSTKS